MSEATASAPESTATPEAVDEPLGHDGPTFVHNGIIRFPMGGKIVRVRRPFLGELRALRVALQDVQDHLTEESNRIGKIGVGYQTEVRTLNEKLQKGEITPEEHTDKVAVVTEADRRTARELDDYREQAMLDWWAEYVFKPIALDPVPEQLQWPTWMLDRTLAAKCLAHWRTVPTGPG